MRAVLLALALHGCITPTAWSERPLGIYPPSAADLNGPPQWLFGVKYRFPSGSKVK